MKTLIVYAHPRKESFCQGILETAVSALSVDGNEVVVRDLCAMSFDPVLKAEETIHVKDGKFVRDLEAPLADVKIEQDLIIEADLLVYIFPIWWNAMPAIMKGYVDRVFAHGFFYNMDGSPDARLINKRAYMISTTGQPQEASDTNGLNDAIRRLSSEWMFSDNNGIKLAGHDIYGSVPYLEEERLAVILDTVEANLSQLLD
ncbi:NAD(P)H-dependent oxidoreductase [Vagococcus sp. BWB3-3]|uniref:NAD(P)H-dependent oxidoreductase n=1 Tax=Vagococcus allomyrinae TaxID=2794353 RepID=A0A940P8Y9_9ENTE|nr:NAD(P)H-dependent oxidoreductase [Vagococcus allomyrinae]MBP1043924.1 NAD(P)H-dependent oxidoreductase [Vagococcus allomyrinae]